MNTPKTLLTLGAAGALLAGSVFPLVPTAKADGLTPTQQQAIQKLVNDLQTIRASGHFTDADRRLLAGDLLVLSTDFSPPSLDSLQKIAEDFLEAVRDGNLSATDLARLGSDLNVVLNSAGLSDTQVQAVLTDLRAILTAAGVSDADLKDLFEDVGAFVDDLRVSFLRVQLSLNLSPVSSGSQASGSLDFSDFLGGGAADQGASLRLGVSNLPTGTYTVRVTRLSNNSNLTLGNLAVSGGNPSGKGGSGSTTFGGNSDQALPTNFHALDIGGFTVNDANGATVLRVSVADLANISKLSVLGHFKFVASPSLPGAFGDVAFQLKIKKGSLQQDRFRLYLHKLPVNTRLTLRVNGVSVGQATTDAGGRLVIVRGDVLLPMKSDGVTPRPAIQLSALVNLLTITKLELVDDAGRVLVSAGL